MAKGCYVGVDNVARKVKKGYVGVDSTARRIKKAYIGIGGVARPCWSGGVPEYYGTITPLSVVRTKTAATTNGDYAIIAGGGAYSGDDFTPYGTVDCYNKSLTRSNADDLSTTRYDLSGASVGNYALFAGGQYSTSRRNTVDAYDSSLVRTTASTLSQARSCCGTCTIGSYALFIGGESSNTNNSTVVNAYNESLTRSTLTALPSSAGAVSSAPVGNYAVFNLNNSRGTLYAYTSSLTRVAAGTMSFGRNYQFCASSVDGYVVFAGGTSTSSNNIVDALDENLTMVSTSTISTVRTIQTTVSIKGFALFGSGSVCVDMFDKSLTNTILPALSDGRTFSSATAIGDYALFCGGGASNTTQTDAVDAYVVA